MAPRRRVRILPCTVEGCDRTFSRKDTLDAHVLKHTGSRPFKCVRPGCTSAFNRRSVLNEHVRAVHDGARPYACSAEGCGKQFSKSSNLTSHVRVVHEGARPFKCTAKGCGKAFAEKAKMNLHVQSVHENVRPFHCSVEGCGKSFTQNSSLTTHLRVMHDVLQPFKCTVAGCEKSFARRDTLQAHLRGFHAGAQVAGGANPRPSATSSGLPSRTSSRPAPSSSAGAARASAGLQQQKQQRKQQQQRRKNGKEGPSLSNRGKRKLAQRATDSRDSTAAATEPSWSGLVETAVEAYGERKRPRRAGYVAPDNRAAETKPKPAPVKVGRVPAASSGSSGEDDQRCQVCDDPKDEDRMLLCDACDAAVHTFCLSPPLSAVPEGDYFCPQCADVEALPPGHVCSEDCVRFDDIVVHCY